MNVGPENVALFDSVVSGVTTVGGTAVQLADVDAASVTLRAAGGNSGTVTIGTDNTITSLGGITLSAGQMVTVPVSNLSKLWAVASASSQKLEHLIVR